MSAPRLDFGILGPLEVRANGVSIDLGPAKQRAVLAALILHVNEVVSVDQLVDQLWGARPPGSARHALQVYVSALRKLLEPGRGASEAELLVTQRPGYVLRLEPDQLDVSRFREAVGQARLALAENAPDVASALLKEALGMWRAGALADLAYEPFAAREVARLEELRLAALEERIDADLALGKSGELVAELEALISSNPLRERLTGQLMLALSRSGRQADALRTYESLKRALGDELGMPPSPTLQRLQEAMVLQEPETGWATQIAATWVEPNTTGMPAGTVTLLLTDIEGSTRLWEESREAMGAALSRHEAVVAEAVADHHGVLVKSRGEGDSTFSVFTRATDAAAAALSLQQALLREQWPAGLAIRVRAAIHTGEVEARGGDYYGPAVNRCARLRDAAHGGQTLVSRTTSDLVQAGLAQGVSMGDLGSHRLRDLARPEQIFELRHRDLPGSFPLLRTLEALPTNLPVQLTSFVGRQEEMAEVNRLIFTTRLLTIVGSGGCGKTRLALQAGADLLDAHPDGVWFADLAVLSDSRSVAGAVASALGLLNPSEGGASSQEELLIEHLRSRTALVILDNCEHLSEACAGLAAKLLRWCPGLRLVATSREPLSVMGEVTWRVPSLSVPSADDERGSRDGIEAFDAVRLFEERARQIRPDFEIVESEVGAVVQICRRLDGIPLAIELAASRVRALSASEIAARLDEGLRFLSAGSRDAAPRQQTLEAAVDWSYQLLPETERALLRRLSIFAGGFTLAAAEAVCAGAGLDSRAILDLLTALIDRSLVVIDSTGTGTRYRLLETIRQYAVERLDEAGETVALRAAHLSFFAALLGTIRVGPAKREHRHWFDRLQVEIDNLHQALDGAVVTDPEAGLQMLSVMQHFWNARGNLEEIDRWLGPLVGHTGALPSPAMARALYSGGALAYRRGDLDTSLALSEQALTIARQVGDDRTVAVSLQTIGIVSYYHAQYPKARAALEESVLMFRARDHTAGIAHGLSLLAFSHIHEGGQGWDTATERPAEESLAIYREMGDRHQIVNPLQALGRVTLARGNYQAAGALFHEALAFAREMVCSYCESSSLRTLSLLAGEQGDWEASFRCAAESLQRDRASKNSVAICLLHLGASAVGLDRFDVGAVLLSASTKVYETIGFIPYHEQRDALAKAIETARLALGDEVFEREWNKGRSMPTGDAVETALVFEAELAGEPPEESEMPRSVVATESRAVFRKEGGSWRIAFRGTEFSLPPVKGLAYLAVLLAHPGREFHALDLVALLEGQGVGPRIAGDAGNVLDEKAKAAYRSRLIDLRSELDEAEAFHDPERVLRIEVEIGALTRELASAVGLGGRDRKAASVSERARLVVTKAIKTAARKIGENSPGLAHHLTTSVRTGTFCTYVGDPDMHVSWET